MSEKAPLNMVAFYLHPGRRKAMVIYCAVITCLSLDPLLGTPHACVICKAGMLILVNRGGWNGER